MNLFLSFFFSFNFFVKTLINRSSNYRPEDFEYFIKVWCKAGYRPDCYALIRAIQYNRIGLSFSLCCFVVFMFWFGFCFFLVFFELRLFPQSNTRMGLFSCCFLVLFLFLFFSLRREPKLLFMQFNTRVTFSFFPFFF